VAKSGDYFHNRGGKWNIIDTKRYYRHGKHIQKVARDTKKIDTKGRFFIPSKQKEELGAEVVVTNSLDVGYLCVYSKEHFEGIREQLGKLNSMDPKVRKIKRAIIGEALEVNVDSQGRISVSAELWEKIGAVPGDEICVFNDAGKLDICTKSFYENEDHDIGSIEGLETTYYVEGL